MPPLPALFDRIKPLARAILPATVYRLFSRAIKPGNTPAPGRVNFGSLRRLSPISKKFGYDRGKPIDRYYIENFLQKNASDIRGSVLEIGDNEYTLRYGGQRVEKSDILHVSPDNPKAIYIADLSRADHIPSGLFDCIILTQTLHLIFDLQAATGHLYRLLKPGGVLLATLPGLCPMAENEWIDDWYWGFTSPSAQRLFQGAFPAEQVQVTGYGNVLASIAFLHGLAAEELNKEELDYRDKAYDLLITVRAEKQTFAA